MKKLTARVAELENSPQFQTAQIEYQGELLEIPMDQYQAILKVATREQLLALIEWRKTDRTGTPTPEQEAAEHWLVDQFRQRMTENNRKL